MQTSKVFLPLISIILITGCGLTNMASKYDTVKFTTNPPILQAHGGQVDLSLNAVFTEKYFDKKATIDFTPVLVYEGGETTFKTITIQGEEATGGEATIFNATGGNFKYQDAIPYSEEMINSNLELRAVAKRKDEEKLLGPKSIGNGVIATSTRVQNKEELANNNHGYEHETILEASATIYFLVNQSNIRITEKSDSDIEALKAFAKNNYKTHSIEIISYASPEGSVNTNNDVSDRRMKSTLNYTKKLLRSFNVDGVDNNDLYTQKSIGEDWDGFETLINKSTIKDKRQINRIVNSISDVEVREQQIRDLAEIYDAIENNVLPQLRKATIIIKSYEPKKSDNEIARLSITSPDSLDVKELLFSATLTDNQNTQSIIYNKVVELYNDWRGYNNIACIHLSNGELKEAGEYLEKAERLQKVKQRDILTNKGILYSRKGNLKIAQQLFKQVKANEKNQAILDIRKGEYAKAARYFKNKKTHNATLAQLMNNNNNVRCNEANAACHYLNAIAATRSANNEEAINNLNKAINMDSSYKNEAIKDLEFINLRNLEAFIKLTK